MGEKSKEIFRVHRDRKKENYESNVEVTHVKTTPE